MLRGSIRRFINDELYVFLYETERHNGIADILELLGSIINGFVIPLKKEHKIFLRRVLIPLHKTKTVGQYHPQLWYNIEEFVTKDPLLSEEVIYGMLKFWPRESPDEEFMFLNELEQILEFTPTAEFVKISRPLFLQWVQCTDSTDAEVAERAIRFWHNNNVVNLVSGNLLAILPIVLPTLFSHARSQHG
jgi:serine/threonine-protein phosphatase 2A regulatory subunit B'